MDIIVRGTVESGRREAARFVSLPWVLGQLRDKAGMTPYAGTLNVRVTDPASLSSWRRIAAAEPRLKLCSPEPGCCDASCFLVLIAGRFKGVVVLPRVDGYPPDVAEVVAEEGLREELGVVDGDEVILAFPEDSP